MTTGAGGRPIWTPTEICALAVDPVPTRTANNAELINVIRIWQSPGPCMLHGNCHPAIARFWSGFHFMD
jgi:hypothetical protein